jgi:hypothetical protein
MANIHKPTSQYLNTPIKDFYLDILTKRAIPQSSNDKIVTIEAKYDQRPDMFANDYFGSPRLWWVLVTRNMDVLIDPIADFKTGVQIFVPNPESIKDLI